MIEQREVYKLQTIDYGQVVKYLGDRPVETAKNGLTRVGTHSRYGFGELRVNCPAHGGAGLVSELDLYRLS